MLVRPSTDVAVLSSLWSELSDFPRFTREEERYLYRLRMALMSSSDI
jgi:hypothetical protein